MDLSLRGEIELLGGMTSVTVTGNLGDWKV